MSIKPLKLIINSDEATLFLHESGATVVTEEATATDSDCNNVCVVRLNARRCN